MKFLFSFLVTLFGGILLGYSVDYVIVAAGGVSELEEKVPRRRFGSMIALNRTAGKTDGHIVESILKTEDLYLLQLTKMGTEEIQKEIDKILKKVKIPGELDILDNLALDFLYSRLGQKAPRHALAQIKNIPEDARDFYRDCIIGAWAEKNPEAVMGYCMEEGEEKDVYTYLHIIEQLSPEKSLEWIKGLPEKEKEKAVYWFFSSVFKSHPGKIEEFIQKAGEIVPFNFYLNNCIASRWIVEDKEAGLKWINSLPEEEQIAIKASALKELPLEEATQEVAALEGKAKETALIEIARSLVPDSSVKAIEWLVNNSGSNLESWTTILKEIKTSAIDIYEPALLAYLTELPSGEKKDILVEKIVRGSTYYCRDLQDDNRGDMLALASQIENLDNRGFLQDSLLDTWVDDSPEEVRQWIEKSDFSQESKKHWYGICDESARLLAEELVNPPKWSQFK